jgi:hypothetical protein
LPGIPKLRQIRAVSVVRMLVGAFLLVAGSVGFEGFTPRWGELWALAYATPLFWVGGWFMVVAIAHAEGTPNPPAIEESSASKGLQAWFWISCAIGVVAAVLLAVLVGLALHFDWLAGRVGGVLAPMGAAVAAAIASAGAARTLMAQSEIAQRNRFEDGERLLWERFGTAAEQFANDDFAIRGTAALSAQPAVLPERPVSHTPRCLLVCCS